MLFFRKKYESYRQFFSEKEVHEFLEKYYSNFFRIIPDKEKNALLISHSRQLQISFHDDEIFSLMRKLQKIAPFTPYDLMLFRGDDYKYYADIDRPFLAHTFLRKTAEKYTENNSIYQVYVPAGSRILPTCGFKSASDVFCEQEVIIETEKLEKISSNVYVYRSR